MLLSYFFLRQVHALQQEIAGLPSVDTLGVIGHPLEGIEIFRALDIPEHLRGKAAILMVATPSCHSCSTELEQFIKLTKQQTVPFHCFVQNEEEHAAVFIRMYDPFVSMQLIEPDIVQKLHINESPFVFMVDEFGVVDRVQRPIKLLISYYRKRVNRKDDEQVPAPSNSTGLVAR